MNKAFKGFSIPDVAILPTEFFDVLPDMNASAELKVTLVALRISLAFGVQDIPYSLRDFEKATGLDRKGVLRGIRAGVERGTIVRVPFRRSFLYRVKFRDGGILPPHACMQQQATRKHATNNKQSAAKSKIFDEISALGVATRVALAIVEKNDLAKLRRHIEYTRYAVENKIANSPPAWFVASVRDNWGPPLGFGKSKPKSWFDGFEKFVNK
jgi:hypothetical protein